MKLTPDKAGERNDYPMAPSAFAKLWHHDGAWETHPETDSWATLYEPLAVDASPDARPYCYGLGEIDFYGRDGNGVLARHVRCHHLLSPSGDLVLLSDGLVVRGTERQVPARPREVAHGVDRLAQRAAVADDERRVLRIREVMGMATNGLVWGLILAYAGGVLSVAVPVWMAFTWISDGVIEEQPQYRRLSPWQMLLARCVITTLFGAMAPALIAWRVWLAARRWRRG